jgi:hypothetical protein
MMVLMLIACSDWFRLPFSKDYTVLKRLLAMPTTSSFVCGVSLALSALLASHTAMAQTPAIFKDADFELGRQLIADNNCNACHAKKFGGDGSAIYRPQGRLTNAGLLRGMVEQCNTTLNLSLFPEEVTAIAAVLNQSYYRHKD